MRSYFLILIILTLSSCGKKTNVIDSYKPAAALISDKPLIIPHNEKGTGIRPKLLNKIVENNFPRDESNSNYIVQIHDELLNIDLSEDEIKDYENKEKIFSKVVVSFSDREEIFFVRERIPAQDLVIFLMLNLEKNRTLKLIPTHYQQTYPGATFYIVSLKHEDLMINDRDFYSEEIEINRFREKKYVESYKNLLIKVTYNYKIQSLEPQVYSSPSHSCTRNTVEDFNCYTACSYSVNLPANKYESVVPRTLLDLGIVLKYGDNVFKMDQLPIFNSKENYFEIKFDSTDIQNNGFSFELINTDTVNFFRTSDHYNFSSTCSLADRSNTSSYTQHTQVDINYKIIIFGRGNKLKSIVL